VYDINDKTFFISKDDYEVSKKKAREQQEAWLDALKSICAEEPSSTHTLEKCFPGNAL
jgi:hypothetical protein